MTDVLTPAQRSLNMRRVRGRDTGPEMRVRRGLYAAGLRYRLHVRSLPGRPDLVFAKHRTVVFMNGCFWHAHGCLLSKLPRTRAEFWKRKLAGNVARDRSAIENLQLNGWRVLVMWECALRGRQRIGDAASIEKAVCYIRQEKSGSFLEISGVPRGSERCSV